LIFFSKTAKIENDAFRLDCIISIVSYSYYNFVSFSVRWCQYVCRNITESHGNLDDWSL